MKRFTLVAILMVGCSPADQHLGGWTSVGSLDDVAPNPDPGMRRGAITLTSDPIIPGDDVTYTVTGAGPGETIHIARSTVGLGAGPCFGTQDGLCLDILPPVDLQASMVADSFGTGTITQTIPERVPIGADVWFQAVVPRGSSGFSWIKSPPYATVVQNASQTLADLDPGDLVITEIMLDPGAVPDADGQWFEITNATAQDANLDGLVISDGVFNFTVTGTLYLPENGRVVIASNADNATNGGVDVDLEWPAGFSMALTWGEVILIRPGTGILDTVGWDGGATFPLGEGASMSLGRALSDATSNDVGANWCPGRAPYGDGDLGTPGADNEYCLFELPSECWSHTEIDDGTRHEDNGSGGGCDDDLGSQWYRFVGASGTRMPTHGVPEYHCGTQATGWLTTAYPTTIGQRVSGTVGFNWVGNTRWQVEQIQISHCDSFYVFQLPSLGWCSGRYCTTY